MKNNLRNAPKGKYAGTVKVGDRGQIVIPKECRDLFGIKPGDTLLLLGDEKRGIAIPPTDKADKLFNVLLGGDEDEGA